MTPQIVRVDYSDAATIFPSERAGAVRRWFRGLLRRLKLIAPEPVPINLFQTNQGAFRFETDDDLAAVIMVSREMLNELGRERAEAFARELAEKQFRKARA